MLNILQSIFGGSSQQSNSTATSTPQDLTPDAYKSLRDPLSSALLSLLQGGGPQQYQGQLTAPITGNEQNVLGQLMQMTGPNNQNSQYLSGVLNGNYLPGGSQGNPFLDAAIKAAQRPTLEGLTQTLTRDLPGRFTAAGQFTNPQGSSAFDRAAATATTGVANAIGDIATNMSNSAYTTERANQQQAVQLNQGEVNNSIANLQAQALPRMIQDNGIQRGLQLFQDRTSQLLQILQTIGGISSPNIANSSQSSSTSTGESQGNAFASLFPATGGGSGTAVKAALG